MLRIHRLASPLCLGLAAACGGSSASDAGTESDSSETESSSSTTSGGETGESGESGETGTPCTPGTEACECAPSETCDDGLACVTGVCVAAPPVCGNGEVEAEEACDDGELNADDAACKSDCSLQECGDGFVGPDESCDDGNTSDDDGCSQSCEPLPFCGDGVSVAGELCFDEPIELWVPGAADVEIGDITNKGTIDVLALGAENATDGTIYVFEGKGDGTFEDVDETVMLGNGEDGRPTRVELVDVGDPFDLGLLDAVVFSPGLSTDRITVQFGTGASQVTFSQNTYTVPGTSSALGLGAIVGTDLGTEQSVIASFPDPATDCTTAEWFTDSSGSAQPTLLTVSKLCTATTVAALHGNFRNNPVVPTDEVALVQTGSDSITTYTAADFLAPPTELVNVDLYLLTQVGSPTAAVKADVNEDGADDLLLATWDPTTCDYATDPAACAGNDLGVVFGAPEGTDGYFTSDNPRSVLGKAPIDIVTADLNNDGHADVASANRFDAEVSVALGDGTGGFTNAAAVANLPTSGANGIAVGDINDDGLPDLAVAQASSNTVFVYLSNP